eukprot:4228601-Pyramimonas_sp.AAC.1
MASVVDGDQRRRGGPRIHAARDIRRAEEGRPTSCRSRGSLSFLLVGCGGAGGGAPMRCRPAPLRSS